MLDFSAVLGIHYYFPPIHSIGAKRNFFMNAEWLEVCEQHRILSTKNVELFPKDFSLLTHRFDITYLETNDYRKRLLTQHSREQVQNTKGRPYGKFMTKLIHSYPMNLMYGEGGRTYIKAGMKAGKTFLEKNTKTILYSSYRPYSDHVIASNLKKLYPDSIWIADFRDADVDPLYKLYLSKRIQSNFNKRILSQADVIICVSEGVKKLIEPFHNKILVLPSGVELRDSKDKYPKFTIAYTGSLYGDHRDPSPLFEAIANLESVRKLIPETFQLVYAGKDSQLFLKKAKKYKVEHLIVDKGIVPMDEAMDIQSKAHINLLLTSSISNYQGILTGKLFEYIGAQVPILCLVNGTEDKELNTIFEKYNLGNIQYSGQNTFELRGYLNDAYDDYSHGKSRDGKSNSQLIMSELSWKAQFNTLLEYIS